MVIIQHGTLVTGQGQLQADLAFENGIITNIAPAISAGVGDRVVDARDMLIFPGFIDGHTHLDMDNGVTVTADDFLSGTTAAVCGGTTTVVDYATQEKGKGLLWALNTWKAKAQGKSACNYGFHMAITQWNPEVKAEIPVMIQEGITSFKAYMAYDALKLEANALLDILKALKPYGGLLSVHCEKGSLVNALQAERKAAGCLGPESHPLSRPPEVEAAAVAELCYLGQMADAPVHVVHLSSQLGLEAVKAARARGVTVYAETCPQYLLLDQGLYSLPGFESAKYVMSPPLRSREDVQALRQAVEEGQIDTIATDHCSYNFAGQKELGRQDFTQIPNGGPGIEHRPGLIYESFVKPGILTPQDMCRLLSENPAKLFGMWPRKGCLAVGADADITIWNPNLPSTISASTHHQKVDYTPYEGFPISGGASMVFVNGQLAAENGQSTGVLAGTYIKR